MFDCQSPLKIRRFGQRPNAKDSAKAESMSDDRIREWAGALFETDLRAFRRARARFLRRPTGERLHDVRVSARRLRSICEDLEEALPRIHGARLGRIIAMTGDARDAAVLRETLRGTLEGREREIARPVLRSLRKRERALLSRICRSLKRLKPNLT
jgi:CHAD domain-containing protein